MISTETAELTRQIAELAGRLEQEAHGSERAQVFRDIHELRRSLVTLEQVLRDVAPDTAGDAC